MEDLPSKVLLIVFEYVRLDVVAAIDEAFVGEDIYGNDPHQSTYPLSRILQAYQRINLYKIVEIRDDVSLKKLIHSLKRSGLSYLIEGIQCFLDLGPFTEWGMAGLLGQLNLPHLTSLHCTGESGDYYLARINDFKSLRKIKLDVYDAEKKMDGL